ncbi:NADH dehydrogenase [ubiquinone] 1 beta subcomplex subunit 5, mitochondrial [Cylas formicarius]|uniref:NADH dehydrogenase [ubiquinone] 1 beta subcomplex subunit 5, mitochondrial n=1 Tax=Cylas formicarius TaxID=197179 RepID=UPI0029588FD4|nr:NADH dehydrogenase [ubiquinone] 1 beta subcomplex subunit 5, mitochondrial [Cylas formicarius]
MSLLSKLKPFLRLRDVKQTEALLRHMSEHRVFPLAPSKWQWKKTKDLFHFYFMLGAIPCTLAVMYGNIFVGPATLSEIPKDYEPKYWEYYRNPITRFIARYIMNNPQQDYEKYCHYIFVEEEKKRLRFLEKEIEAKIAERDDYQAYYYKPVTAKYQRVIKESADTIKHIRTE